MKYKIGTLIKQRRVWIVALAFLSAGFKAIGKVEISFAFDGIIGILAGHSYAKPKK